MSIGGEDRQPEPPGGGRGGTEACPDSEEAGRRFDCSVCLRTAADPVVTLCGHLYCWPCIYEWIHTDANPLSSVFSSSGGPRCPVCKSPISESALVPIYGGGGCSRASPGGRKAWSGGFVKIPPRPSYRGAGGSLSSPPLWRMAARFLDSVVSGVLRGVASTVLPAASTMPRGGSGDASELINQQPEVEKLNKIFCFCLICLLLCLMFF